MNLVIKKKKVALFFIAAAFFLYNYACAATSKESSWEVKKSNHFAVYYKKMESNDYVNDVLSSAEKYYEEITDSLGFCRFEFWTWEKQCKIYIYPTVEDYCSATLQPAYFEATSYVKERAIRTFVRREEFLETMLPHEMTHLILREFIGYKIEIPLWLDEGMASLYEAKNRKLYIQITSSLTKSDIFIPLSRLTRITKEGLTVPSVFYVESASVVEFLLDKYGKEKLVDYCRYLRDNKNWEEGLKVIYGFKNLSDMNDKWIEFLSAENINTIQ